MRRNHISHNETFHIDLKDCPLFVPKGGGVKFSKSMKKGGLKYKLVGRGKLLETVVSTLV